MEMWAIVAGFCGLRGTLVGPEAGINDIDIPTLIILVK
jgi:hypothetical protein